MLQQKAEFNNRPIEALLGFLDGYAQVAEEEFNTAFEVVQPLAMGELKYVPERRQWPDDYPEGQLEWTSEKQQNAYWATDGFGAGIPYQRTGRLPEAWEFTKQGSGLNIIVSIINRDPAAPFVYGSLAKTNPGRFMQQFHAITGWVPAYETAQFWLDALQEQYIANMTIRLGDEMRGTTSVRTRAFTYTGGRRS